MGFTLIELLVAIALFALLVSIVVIGIKGTKAKARDAKRIAEVDSLRKAVELYYADHNSYPTTTGWVSIEEDIDLQTKLQPYLPAGLQDPLWGEEKDPDHPYSYQYCSTGTDGAIGYKIHVELETGDNYEISGGSEGESITYIGSTELTRWASFKFNTYGNDPKWLTIKHLDGQADDSFDLSINGEVKWSYADQTSNETWYTDHISLDIIGETELIIKLEATGEKWSHWDTYGQVAISHCWLRLDDGLIPGEVDSEDTIIDEIDIGDPVSEANHDIAGWGPIEPETHGGTWGGIAEDPEDQTCRVIWSPTE